MNARIGSLPLLALALALTLTLTLTIAVALALAACAGPERVPHQPIPGVDTEHTEVRDPHVAADSPKLFRVILQVSDLERAFAFYSELLGVEGRKIRGSRAYFDCGPVILAILDPTPGGVKPAPNPDCVYFAVGDLERVHARAAALRCLSTERVDGAPAGDIATRPWGERSFYAFDPFGNELCFVDEQTMFTGR